LLAPAKELAAQEAQRVADLMLLASRAELSAAGEASQSPTRSAFAVLQGLPRFDRGLAATCLPCVHQYELDVAQAALRRLGPRATLDQASLELSGWRRRGLLYPLLVACARMPSPAHHWRIPKELAQESSARGLADLLAQLAELAALPGPTRDQEQAALEAFVASQDPGQASARHIADTLDRVAIAMRVRSNASARDEHYLDRCLDRLPRLDAMDAPELWACLPHHLERTLPPLALAQQPDGWGYGPPRYELLQSEQRLRFAPQTLQASPAQSQALSPKPKSLAMRQLQALVQRLAHACLSPELAQVMLYPDAPDVARSLGPSAAAVCRDPARVLQQMRAHEPTDPLLAASRAYLRALPPPPPSRPCQPALRTRACALAWRVETPRRVVLFTGADALASSAVADMAPHALPKLCLAEPSLRPELARITVCPAPPTPDGLRAHVLRAARSGALDTGFIERVARAGKSGAQSTVLEEAVLAFTSGPPPDACHTTVPLNGSRQWQEGHVDPRYAETQRAETDGFRYRDWVCVFADDRHLEKCRLEAHALPLAGMHEAVVPWIQRGAHRGWVTVRSSLPFQDLAILTRSARPADTLAAHLRARYSLDPSLLPTRSPTDTVERQNLAVYSDGLETCIAYSPTPRQGPPRLEFVAFRAR